MKRLLGKVAINDDKENQKRIQAHIIGLTDGLPDEDLPWAFPLDDQCIIPEKDDDVWIYVDQTRSKDSYDYNRLWYRRFTEKTYKEAYDYSNSESAFARKLITLLNEPDAIGKVTYPENKVAKYGGVTLEYDKTNGEYRITTEDGSYMTLGKAGNAFKSTKDSYDGTFGKKTIETTTGTEIKSGSPLLEPQVLGNILFNYLSSLTAWAAGHVHLDPLSGVTLAPATPPPAVIDFRSSKNKVD